jgi:GT2 family glycosyltransferase/glycosyltransferase involved in cell wall biosynthesis
MPFDKSGLWTIPGSETIQGFKDSLLAEEQLAITPTPELISALTNTVINSRQLNNGAVGKTLFNAAAAATGKTVDIVIPIYDGLYVLKQCIDSIFNCTKWKYHLFLVDDASPDPKIKSYLNRFALETPVTVLHNQKNRGFPATVNRGVFTGTGDYVCVLNSDVIVTPWWLTKLVLALESDERNQIVNPVTNNTALINVEMYPGRSYLDMNSALENQDLYRYPEIMPTGFCYMFKRGLVDKIGMFDEAYGKGFGEETDHWCRALKHVHEDGTLARYRAILADNCYIFHQRSASFSQLGSDALMSARRVGNERFHQKNPGYKEWIKGFSVDEAITPLRTAIPETAFIRDTKENFAFVVKSAGPCGGMYYISDIVNQMIEDGHNVKVCIIPEPRVEGDTRPLQLVGTMHTMPIVFEDEQEFIDRFTAKVFDEGTILPAVAEVVPTVVRLLADHPKLRGINHVQSYDPDLARILKMPEDKISQLEEAYLCFPNLVNSKQIANTIKAKGGTVLAVISPGIDCDLFHQRNRDRGDDRPTIGVMALKTYAFKRYDRAVEICKAIWSVANDQDKEIRILAIGVDAIPECPYVIGMGGVSLSQMAALLGDEIDVLVDPSELHSYGLPALEALASGCSVFCWENEGINEYRECFNPDRVNVIHNDTPHKDTAIHILNALEAPIDDKEFPIHHTRQNAVRSTINLLATDKAKSHIKIKVITPHMRKHGGPTTLIHMANVLSDKHDVSIDMIYTDFNPEVLNTSIVPVGIDYNNLSKDTNICIINSDNPFAEEIIELNPHIKYVMMKLSHNERFKDTESYNLNLPWDHIMTSTAWLKQACMECGTGWEHKTWDENKVTCVGWHHYGHAVFSYPPQNKAYGDAMSGVRVGTLVHGHPLKGTQTAVEAFTGLKKKWEGLFKAVGVGETKAKLPQYWNYFRSLNRSQMAQIFRQLDIWFGASHTEGLGRMTLEAMSAGVAVVTTDTGAEFLRDGENCLLYKPGDAQRGAELIDQLIQDKELFTRLVIDGHKTATRAADTTNFILNINKVIDRVTKGE